MLVIITFVICCTLLSVLDRTHWKYITSCLSLRVDSCYCDIVGQELIWQCQSEVRAAAASCIHWVSRCHCWFILNLIVDGSIRVEWGQPVQFNGTRCHISNYGEHAWWGGGCGEERATGDSEYSAYVVKVRHMDCIRIQF